MFDIMVPPTQVFVAIVAGFLILVCLLGVHLTSRKEPNDKDLNLARKEIEIRHFGNTWKQRIVLCMIAVVALTVNLIMMQYIPGYYQYMQILSKFFLKWWYSIVLLVIFIITFACFLFNIYIGRTRKTI